MGGRGGIGFDEGWEGGRVGRGESCGKRRGGGGIRDGCDDGGGVWRVGGEMNEERNPPACTKNAGLSSPGWVGLKYLLRMWDIRFTDRLVGDYAFGPTACHALLAGERSDPAANAGNYAYMAFWAYDLGLKGDGPYYLWRSMSPELENAVPVTTMGGGWCYKSTFWIRFDVGVINKSAVPAIGSIMASGLRKFNPST